jgi:hypothetical protein
MAKNKENRNDWMKNYELEIKNSRATAKRYMAYTQARSNLSNKKKNK